MPTATQNNRYGDVAVGFHWLIAILIIGLLIVGKFMTGLEDTSPLRFTLTQWHKTFGVMVLLFSILRLAWRFMHAPPPPSAHLPAWQHRVASAVHVALYLLMLVIPLTGWIMVSASPLNLDTLLFNVIPWPHLPPFDELANKAAISDNFKEYHELAGHLLIVLFLAHAGAALKHHFIDHDDVLQRMRPRFEEKPFRRKLTAFLAIVGIAATAVIGFAVAEKNTAGAVLNVATETNVSFEAMVSGDAATGSFPGATVTATLDAEVPANSTLSAVVPTGDIQSDDSQVESSLPDAEWFDSATYPEARFTSTRVAGNADGSYQVDGDLTIKETTRAVSFPLVISDEADGAVARGEFVVDRREFDIGMESQTNPDYVGFDVNIRFHFSVAEPSSVNQSSSVNKSSKGIQSSSAASPR